MPPWIVQQWKPEVGELADQEIQGVLVLGEDQEPLGTAGQVLGNHAAEFLELGFRDVLLGVLGQPNQPVQLLDFGLQFGHVLGHREPFDHFVLELPAVGLGQVVQVFGNLAIFLLDLAQFAKVAEPFQATFQRHADCGKAGCKAALKHGQGQADVAVFGGHRPLEVVLDVLGDGIVQVQFVLAEPVGKRLDVPGREARRAIELLHVLLEPADHNAVFVVGARLGQDVAGDVQVAVEQLQQQGEVVGIALVRRGRQEKEVVGTIAEELAQLVPLGLVDLVAVLVGGHLVGFVHDTKSQCTSRSRLRMSSCRARKSMDVMHCGLSSQTFRP